MSTIDETLAIGLQTRRFACDRCHHQKLKCERESVFTSDGFSLPIGPCKRCRRIGTDCTTRANSGVTVASASTGQPLPVLQEQEVATEPGAVAGTEAEAEATERQDEDQDTVIHVPTTTTVPPTTGSTSSNTDFAFQDGFLDLTSYTFDLEFDPGRNASIQAAEMQIPHSFQDMNIPTPQGAASGEQGPGSGIHTSTASGALAASQSQPSSNLTPVSTHSRPISGNTTVDSDSEVPSHLNKFEQTLDSLARLHTYIFQEFRSLDPTSRAGDATSLSGSITASAQDTVTDKVVCASEKLLELLAGCGRSETTPQPVISTLPSDVPRRSSNSLSYSARLQNEELESLYVPSPHNHGTKTRNASVDPRQRKRPRHEPEETLQYPDLASPARLSLLVCYVSLLTMYRNILGRMLVDLTEGNNPLRASSSSTSFQANAKPTPRFTKPDVLNIRIRLEVLMHMLEQFDDAWAIALQRGQRNAGNRHSSGPELTILTLQSLLAHEGFECEKGDSFGVGSLIPLIKKIKWAVRAYTSAD
ncbi:hypothetical protein PG985_014064 [Apiospora marii]|uniref:Zn(2)-C6 fungal-type domain-containing protein n=1 Tax=Apiospora marii TaxID=335849 RepID=A0ABR1R606_9PEZI